MCLVCDYVHHGNLFLLRTGDSFVPTVSNDGPIIQINSDSDKTFVLYMSGLRLCSSWEFNFLRVSF